MGTKAFAAAAIAAAMTVATPAAALTLTFDVTATSAVGVPGFTPFSFQETWAFTPAFSSVRNPAAGAPYAIVDKISGPPTITDSPVTYDLALYPHTFETFDAAFTSTRAYDDSDNLTDADLAASFRHEYRDLTGFAGGAEDGSESGAYVFYYFRTLDFTGSGLPASMDEAGLVAFLKGAGSSIVWTEGYISTIDYSDPSKPDVFLEERSYRGVASLAAVNGAALVPEPSTWALTIGGFAVAGGALRARRRRAA